MFGFTQEQITSSIRLAIGYGFSILAALNWLPDWMGDAFQQQVIAAVIPVIHIVFSVWNARAAGLVAKAAALPEVKKIVAEPAVSEVVTSNKVVAR